MKIGQINVKLNKNAPYERESSFFLALFSFTWEQRELGEVANRYDNLRVPITASDRTGGNTPYYGANGIQDYVKGYTHNGEFVLVAEDGANDLKNYPVQYVNGEIWVNNHAHVLQGKAQKANNKYLKFAISQMDIEPFLVGGGRAKLNADIMMKMQLNMPIQLQEQTQIGTFFKTLDNLITCHQRECEFLYNRQNAWCSKTINKITHTWEQRELGEMTDCTIDNRGKTPPLSDDGIPLIEIASVGNFDVDYSKVTKWISEETFDNALRNYLNHGDILFSTVGTTALCSSYNASVKGAVAQNIIGLRYSRFDSNFMMFMLTEPRNNNHIKSIQMNGVQGSIKVPQLLKLEFKVAKNIKEQTKIGSFFATLDNLITCHQRKPIKTRRNAYAYRNNRYRTIP